MEIDHHTHSELARTRKNVDGLLNTQGRPVLRASRDEGKKVIDEAQASLLRFSDADADGNMRLDFDEFHAMLPVEVRDEFDSAQLRAWFDAADLDGSGELSMSEYFVWTLRNATETHGGNVIDDCGGGCIESCGRLP